jgi:hypothetical protein
MKISKVFRKTETLAQIIQTLCTCAQDIKLAKKFDNFKFQIKVYIHRYICCKKKRASLGKDFYSLYEKFEVYEHRVQNYLTVDHSINLRHKLQLYTTEMFKFLV